MLKLMKMYAQKCCMRTCSDIYATYRSFITSSLISRLSLSFCHLQYG